MNAYSAGSTVRLEVAFSTTGTLSDPTSSVICQVLGPTTNAIQTPSVVKESVGVYYADVVATDSGLWTYRFSASNPAAAAEGSFVVKPSAFT